MSAQDSEQWDSLYAAVASRCYLIAGAASRSVSKLLEDRNISPLKYHGLIIKHTNQTTMSDLVEITHLIYSLLHHQGGQCYCFTAQPGKTQTSC